MTSRHSIETAKSPGAGSLPKWWLDLSDGGRKRYLEAHPGSRLRNVEVRQLAERMTPEEKADVRAFIGRAADKDGPLAKAASERLKVANVPKHVVPQIAQLLRAADGDEDAIKAVDAKGVDDSQPDRPSRRARTRGAHEILEQYKKKLGRMPTQEELKTGMAHDGDPGDDSEEDTPAPPPERSEGKGKPDDPEDYERRARAKLLGTIGLLVVGAAILGGNVPVGIFTPELIGHTIHYIQGRKRGSTKGRDDRSVLDDYIQDVRKAFMEGFTGKQVESSLVVNEKSDGSGGREAKDDTDRSGGRSKRTGGFLKDVKSAFMEGYTGKKAGDSHGDARSDSK